MNMTFYLLRFTQAIEESSGYNNYNDTKVFVAAKLYYNNAIKSVTVLITPLYVQKKSTTSPPHLLTFVSWSFLARDSNQRSHSHTNTNTNTKPSLGLLYCMQTYTSFYPSLKTSRTKGVDAFDYFH